MHPLQKRRHRGRKRHLRLEQLESRRQLAAILVVDSVEDARDLDPGDGVCEISPGGPCTLRAAIQEANQLENVEGVDQIRVPAGLFQLTIDGVFEQQALSGDLDITDDVIIQGSGASATIIDGGALDRVFDVVFGVVSIRNVTVRGGQIVDLEDPLDGSGGGIRNEGELHLVGSVVSGNVASFGAGIANYNGSLQISASTITGNGSDTTLRGGGVHSYSNFDPTNVQITDTTISGNRADVGGGISNFGYDESASITLSRSTLSGNSAREGGGIANHALSDFAESPSATVTIKNSTVSGNTADLSGGGLHNRSDNDGLAIVELRSSTIAFNTASDAGGGILNLPSNSGSLTLHSTIVSNNTAGNSGSDMATNVAVASFSLIEDPLGHPIAHGTDQNLVGAEARLDALSDNGGFTLTHSLLDGSPAIDQGSSSGAGEIDGRGTAFARIIDVAGISNAGDGADIGAVEVGQVGAADDFGDAPELISVGGTVRRYPTRLTSDGARHRVVDGGPYLGAQPPDAEPNAVPSAAASGDDSGGLDDEDGLLAGTNSLTPGSLFGPLTVSHHGGSAGAVLSAWVDFNLDGDFSDVGEQILSDVNVGAGAGSTSLASLSVPEDAIEGTTFIRLRISTQAGLTAVGSAVDGEVEDHRIIIGAPPPRTADLSLTQTTDAANPSLGDTVNLTVRVTNVGPDRADNVEVSAALPLDLGFVRSIVSQGSYDDFDGIWTIGTLPAGATATLHLAATVETTDPIVNTAEVLQSDADDPDSTPGNAVAGEDDLASVTLGSCLTSEGPLTVGINRLVFSCASPGSFSAFVQGSLLGTTELRQYGVNADIANAQEVAIAVADDSGIAVAFVNVAAADLGTTLRFQAFEMAPSSSKSNTLPLEVMPGLPTSPLDVNNDRIVSAFDALLVINQLARAFSAESEQTRIEPTVGDGRSHDINGDGQVTAMDALTIINHLSQHQESELVIRRQLVIDTALVDESQGASWIDHQLGTLF